MKSVTAKLGTMRKPQEFTVYPWIPGKPMTVQSDKSIGEFDPETGKGKLNTKGCYFPHLMFAQPYEFPKDFVIACKVAAFDGNQPVVIA